MNRKNELRQVAYEFAHVVKPPDFVAHWEKHAALLEGCRMVYSAPILDSPFPGSMATRTFGSDPKAYLNGYFDGPGFLILDNQIVSLHKKSEKVPLAIDVSVSLDSNFVGDIHKFMTGKSLDARWPAFLETAHYLRKHNVNLDAIPYLIENFQKAKADERHLNFVVNGFATFYRFSTGRPLTDNPAGLSDFEFTISESAAKELARSRVSAMIDDPAMAEEQTLRLWHRQDVLLTLLLIAIEYYACKHESRKEKLLWLMQTLEETAGRIPDREILFALIAFTTRKDPKGSPSPFFANQWPVPYNRSQNIIDLIKNMAWDISFYRVMQTWASKKGDGNFAVPFFLTFDWKLADLSEIYECRVLLIDDAQEAVYAVPTIDVRKVLMELGYWDDFKRFFDPERVRTRLESRVSYDQLSAHCRAAEAELSAIIAAQR